MSTLRKIFRLLSAILFLFALGALIFLLLSDTWFRFQPGAFHRRAEAFVLMSLGASFISMQIGTEGRSREKLKGILLGLGFVLWGCEQDLPPGSGVTAVDTIVITIFVVDLGLVIKGALAGDSASGPANGRSPRS
jgi:hypothetical protein